MTWLKICRELNKHQKDNLVDIAGYAGVLEKVIDEKREESTDIEIEIDDDGEEITKVDRDLMHSRVLDYEKLCNEAMKNLTGIEVDLSEDEEYICPSHGCHKPLEPRSTLQFLCTSCNVTWGKDYLEEEIK